MRRNYAGSKGKSKIGILKIIGLSNIAIAIFILFGFVIKFLWNSLMPDLFGLSEITYFQGLGLFVLGKILFGGFDGQNSNGKLNKGINIEIPRKEKQANPEDEIYDRWWSSEGEKAFTQYIEEKNR